MDLEEDKLEIEVKSEKEGKSEKEEKLQYLTEEIIEQNFDPRLFTLHCESTKEANIDLWTLDELKECVREFKKKYKSGQTLEKLQESGTILIPGLKLAPSELSSIPSLDVQISEPNLVSSGFFTQNYIVYTVRTLPLEWEVTREFSDFTWLRKIILLSFPGIFIPTLPQMKNRGNISEDTSKKRQKILYKFMQCLISHPLVLRSEQLRIFLKQANVKAFKDYIDRDETEAIQNIQNFPCIDGNLVGDLMDHSENVVRMQEYYKYNAYIMRILKEKAKKIVKDLENSSSAVVRMIESVGKLEELQDALSFTKEYAVIYSGLKTHFIKLLEVQRKKIEMVDQHLIIFFKYGHLEQQSLKGFVEQNEVYATDFRKALLKHSEGMERIRELYAYFNSQNFTETRRINEFITLDSYQNFFTFCLKQAELSKELQETWKELLDKINP